MDFIKEDTVLGTKKVVVGDKFHDLVLENLGKIYIRYGNSYKEFNALMLAVSKGVASGGSKVIIEENGISDDLSIYPNGSLVYDAKSGILYLIFNGEAFILAEHVNTNSNRYVLKTGDVMTGVLTINTREAPLKVKSTELVKNLNANYLQGYDASAFAKRNYDETINGNWTFTGENTFTNKNTFEDTAIFKATGNAAIRVATGDIITDGSLGSSIFVSGMNGSGWRLDGETNTLEIDNLIVRGILNVFELVVNKVSATNGSLWVTDSFKVKTVHDIVYVKCTSGLTFSSIDLSLDKYYIFYQDVTQTQVVNSFYEAGIDLTQMTVNESTGEEELTIVLSLLNKYNYAKITVPGEAFSTRIHKGTESKQIGVFKYVFQIISIEKLKSNATPLALCNANKLEELLADGIIDFTCIYQMDAQDIPDKMVSADEVFNQYFDLNYFRIVTNPQFNLSNSKYYFLDEQQDLASVNLYYKYFGGGDLYILESENDQYPVFRPGDILRCLKFTGKSVKQYHGIVCGTIGSYGFIMLIQNHSILNSKVEIAYDEEGNLIHWETSTDNALYSRSDSLINKVSQEGDIDPEKYTDGIRNLDSDEATQEKKTKIEDYVSETSNNDSDIDIKTNTNADEGNDDDTFRKLCTPQEGDGLVRVGSIVWGTRRNSMYLTSSEDYSPFQDIMVNVNRPDYGVVYFTPKIRKCTVQVMIDEENELFREQQVYLQNKYFCDIMDEGFDYIEQIASMTDELSGMSQEDEGYSDLLTLLEQKRTLYESWKISERGKLFLLYKDKVLIINVPTSQSDEGDQDFYGLTNLKDVYLTYCENDYEPKYHTKTGERVKAKYKFGLNPVTFYTAPKVENQPIKVITTDKSIHDYDEANYSSDGTSLTKIAIGWRV